MPLLYLLLGSNVGHREGWLADARAAIAQEVGIIRQSSAIYETAAWGKEDQAAFLNQALAVEVHENLLGGRTPQNAAQAVLSRTTAIEATAGRARRERWEPRTLDIDLLLWGDAVLSLPDLTLPHPALPQRRFALQPLAEIAAGVVHPIFGKTVAVLLGECPDLLAVRRLEPLLTSPSHI